MTPGALAALGLCVAVWLGGGNLAARRWLRSTKGPLGPRHDAWFYRGLLVAPDWLSYTIVGAGLAMAVVAGVWAAVD